MPKREASVVARLLRSDPVAAPGGRLRQQAAPARPTVWFVNLMGGKGTKPSEALHDWAEMRLKQLDGWLTNRRFIATDDFTVADILMTHVLDAGTRDEMLKPYANILAYRARCTERPAWKKSLEAYLERVEAA